MLFESVLRNIVRVSYHTWMRIRALRVRTAELCIYIEAFVPHQFSPLLPLSCDGRCTQTLRVRV